jgi:hypothetical protein
VSVCHDRAGYSRAIGRLGIDAHADAIELTYRINGGRDKAGRLRSHTLL